MNKLARFLLAALVLSVVLSCRPEPPAPPAIVTVHRVYLPLAMNNNRIPQPAGALSIGVMNEGPYSNLDKWLLPGQPVKIDADWSWVETARGVYDWATVDSTIGDYKPFIFLVKNTPKWALPLGETWQCRLPARQYWPDFVRFTNAAIERYRPEYIEIWNEPDGNANMYPWFGCVKTGKEYAEFINAIVPQIRGAKVIAGALMFIDRDWARDMFKHLNADVTIGWHCYDEFIGTSRGNCVEAKRAIEAMTDYPLMLTETAVIHYSGKEGDYNQAQINHVRWLDANFDVSIWYSINNCYPAPPRYPTDYVCRNIPRPAYWELWSMSR